MGFNVFYMILGLIKVKRWSKAPKCKRLTKQLRSRLTIQKSRMNAIIRQSRADIAELMHNGLHDAVSKRVEQLYKDYSRLSAYHQLEGFCECICTNLRDISRGSKLSDEVREALSTLIFASSRCGELPELHSVRNLFKQHFGQKFERVDVELLPGNTVSSDIKHNLIIPSIPEEIKLKLINEIVTEYTHQPEALDQQKNLFAEFQKLQGNPSTKSGKFTTADRECKDLDADDYFRSHIQASKFEAVLQKIGLKLPLANLGTSWSGFSNSADSAAGSVTTAEFPKEDYNVENQLCSYNNWVADLSSKSCTKKNITDDIFNKQKGSISGSSNVHPKLPDYDELVRKFTNLKKCSQQNSNNQGLFKKAS